MSLFSPDQPHFIRGVNIGGWLIMERYITPYSFAVTDCHQRGDFCWYPNQIDAPPEGPANLCNITECEAVLSTNAFGKMDYPLDEWNLNAAFDNQTIGAEWLNYHFDNFLKKEDLVELKKAGITHIRVPLPHWILGNVHEGEPWIPADRWKYFLRMCDWAREIGLEVWPNIHTAPGSQNGFDNSGVQNSVKTCGGWTDNPKAIQRSLDVIKQVVLQIRDDDLLDVVTGFGLLNEPFGDCNFHQYKMFLHDGRTIVRDILGEGVGIFMSDLFQAYKFNDGRWGLTEEWNNTFLDSHYYNIFAPAVRSMNPKQHIEHICHPEKGESVRDCCFENPPVNTVPSHGTQRIVAEWSAAYDAMPGEVLKVIMKGIHEYGEAPLMDRTISEDRKEFLTKMIEAQIVSYEAADTGVAHGWFYWNFKMEGGAYIEWDMLRGIREKWFPEILPPDIPSFTEYGTCEQIKERTDNSTDIVHPYPWIDPVYWRGPLVNESDIIKPLNNNGASNSVRPEHHRHFTGFATQIMFIVGAVLLLFGIREYFNHNRARKGYTEIQG